MSIREIIIKADREINEILTGLESDLKSKGMKISSVSVDRDEFNIIGQRESDQLFSTEVHVEIRR